MSRKTQSAQGDQAGQFFDSARQNLKRALQNRHCIGITGLSRSGKSTLICSLINQLRQHQHASLGGFSPVISQRLLEVRVHPLEDTGLAEFPYEQAIEALSANPPRWPEPTTDISGCLLELKLKQNSSLKQLLGAETGSVFLELRDYPGEWLLDLPMMQMSYVDWCAQSSRLFNQPPRLELIGDLLEQLQQLDPLASYDEATCQRLRQAYVAFLKRCKGGEHSLSLVQPGRFLLPGQFRNDPVLGFVPLPGCSTLAEDLLKSAPQDSYYKVFERRYRDYVKRVVRPFYQQQFRPITRQVVLIDLVNALNGGSAYIDDMRQAIAQISESFHYGRNNPLRKLFAPQVEELAFVATKMDQVIAADHESVRQLLGQLVRDAYSQAAHRGAAPRIEAIAAIRASREVIEQGRQALSGYDLSGRPVGYVHPPIPSRLDDEAGFSGFRDWKIPAFQPPVRANFHHQAIPHIRLDSLLELITRGCRHE
ncbi:YcjX family protein [Motiliproteus sp.]|uniref:YcjX family protein n=1 Tax=Motiliproteus sp. TaxID=1898955 RepID=UPI003BAD4D48